MDSANSEAGNTQPHLIFSVDYNLPLWNFDPFYAAMRTWLESDLKLPIRDRDLFSSVVYIAWEAAINAYDHGARSGTLHLIKTEDSLVISCWNLRSITDRYGKPGKEGFLEALQPGWSSKFRTRDCIVRGCPGYGFTNLFSAVEKLKAVLSIESGEFRYSNESGSFVLSPAKFIGETKVQAAIPLRGIT